jgi:hypothetical protein
LPVALETKLSLKIEFVARSLSEVELLQFLTLNLCGFDPGLEAGSR